MNAHIQQPRKLVLACNLNPGQTERLQQHPSRPHVVQLPVEDRAWEVPSDAEVLFTSLRAWKSVPAKAPDGWPGNLKWIQTIGVGTDAFPDWVFDVPSFTTGRGITSEAIAEYVIATIFAREKQFFDMEPVRSAADWKQRTLGQLGGRQLALLGFGSIGRQVAAKALALGMKIAAVTETSAISEPREVEQRSRLDDLIRDADHLVVCAPLTPGTRRLINTSLLVAAKPGLHLINVSRGALVDNDALLGLLARDPLATATLDVTDPEPLPDGHAFYSHARIRLTPHISWNAPANEERTAELLAANLSAWVAGEPLINRVERDRLPSPV